MAALSCQRFCALSKVFGQADAEVVQKAVQASSSLNSISICADEKALRAPYPPPKTAEAKTKVAVIREELSEVEALGKTGKYKEGLELVKKLETKSRAVDYQPVMAEVLFQVGNILDSVGEYKKAETTLQEAARIAGKVKDTLLAAKALTELVWVVGYKQARHKEGMVFAQNAEIMLSVAGGQNETRSQLLNSIGVILRLIGDNDRALSYYRKSLAIKEKTLGAEHPEVASSYNNMGIVYRRQGEFEQALEAYSKTLAISRKTLGPEHPNIAIALGNLGLVYRDQGKYEKALDSYQKAIVISKNSLGLDHPDVARILNSIGSILRMKGEHEKVLEYYRKALAIRVKALGHDHPDVAQTLGNIGVVFSSNKEYEKALECFRRSLKIKEKALGSENPQVAWSLNGIGSVLLHQGKPKEALGAFERLVHICEAKTCDKDAKGQGLFGLARALVATGGDNPRAIKLAKQAREIFSRTPKRFEKELEEVNTWLQKHGASKLAKKVHTHK